jgi:Na+-transporting NADH:ubiquinone oxidoreductase subunit A
MIKIRITKGYTQEFEVSKTLKESVSKEVALTPCKLPFVKPKLLVKKGDLVKTGSAVYFDKRDPEIKFLSPGSGTVKDIVYGERRVITKILIELKGEEHEDFEKVETSYLKNCERSKLVDNIIKGGLWSLFKELPYRDYPKRDRVPPKIIVNLNSSEVEGPDPMVYLKGEEKYFLFGLKVLERLSDEVVVVSGDSKDLPCDVKKTITHTVEGPYPANDPGVLLYHTKKRIPENSSWYLFGQDLILIAKLLLEGKYPTSKIVTVAGASDPQDNCHYKARIGISINDLINSTGTNDYKVIQGGAFKGYDSGDQHFSGFFENSFTLLKSDGDDDLFGFMMPGFKKNSVSRTFLSFLNKEKEIECSLNGEERACVNCGTCAKYCPVDMFPNITYKAVYADEPEEAAFSGLLDCVECGVCSFVCPSKIELAMALKKAKEEYYKEQV